MIRTWVLFHCQVGLPEGKISPKNWVKPWLNHKKGAVNPQAVVF
jgi:hypothetical protein